MNAAMSERAMVRLYLGIDGGGTGTRAFVCDASGQRAGWGKSGASNPNHADAAEVRRNLAEATRQACGKLKQAPASVVSAFLGIAGLTENPERERMLRCAARSGLARARLGVDHDIRIALAGGLAGRLGIALVVGTGSSCYGRNASGKSWQGAGSSLSRHVLHDCDDDVGRALQQLYSERQTSVAVGGRKLMT